jgi:hypothetical protein
MFGTFYNLPRGLGFPVIPATLQRQTSSQKQARTPRGEMFFPTLCGVLASPLCTWPLHRLLRHLVSTTLSHTALPHTTFSGTSH